MPIKVPDRKYWQGRFLQLEKSLHEQGLKTYVDIENQYREAQRQLETEILAWYQRFANTNGITLLEARKMLTTKELAEFKWTVEDYIRYGEKNAIDGLWQKQLENASARYHISRLDSLKIQLQQNLEVMFGNQLDTLDSMVRNIYTEGYYHTAYEIQKGVGAGWKFASIDEKRITKIINRPWAVDGRNFSERIWGNKQKLINELDQELTQNIVLGKDPKIAINNLSKKFGTSKSQAGALVMTEEAFFASAAQRDCYAELDVDKYENVVTLDSHTSEICQALDGVGRSDDEPYFLLSEYKVGETAPPFHVRCRTVTVPWFDDDFGAMVERAARDTDGEIYYVPDSMKYPEWKKSFVDNKADELKPFNGSGIIKKKIPFNPSTTIEEAETFARSLGVPNVSYKGVDITTANAWNEGLADNIKRFPELKKNFGFVGEAHERNTMLKPTVKQYYLDELKRNNPTFTMKQLEPYADEHVKKIMKMLEVGKDAYAQSWSPSTAPFSDFRGVTVNRDWGNNSADFIKALVNDVESKFHPTGCDTIRSVLDHEIGHQLDDLLDIRSIPKIQELYDNRTFEELTEELSKYSWENNNKNRYSEMIAEAWAEYCNNPKPRKIAKVVGKAIEAEYKTKFK